MPHVLISVVEDTFLPRILKDPLLLKVQGRGYEEHALVEQTVDYVDFSYPCVVSLFLVLSTGRTDRKVLSIKLYLWKVLEVITFCV